MFHENLKTQRKLKGYTQEALAIKVNVVRQTVSKWEKGLSVPDADTLQKLAEVLEISVSQLLGADIPDDSVSRNEIAEQLSRINEQLAIKNRRGRRIWKGILVVLILIVIFMVIIPIFLSILGKAAYANNTAAGRTEWVCQLDGEEYIYSVEYNDNYQILSAGGNTYIDEQLDAGRYSDANELAEHIEEYFEEKGGTVSVTSAEGLKIKEE